MAIPKGKQRVMITLEEELINNLDKLVKITNSSRSDCVHDALLIMFAVANGDMEVIEARKEEAKHEVN